MSLIVLGTLAYDSIQTVHETREDALGGSAVYFACAAAKFGPVGLVGVVGEDFKSQDVELLRSSGIDVSGVEHASGRTFRWSGRYEADWNTRHTLATHLNVLERFDPKVPASMRKAQYVFLANSSPAVQRKALSQVEKPRFVVVDTMNLWIDIAREELCDLLRHVDGVVLNDEEARMLTGERNLIRAASRVLTMGPRYVILKKGEHGAYLLGTDVRFSLPAYPVEDVIDPTGAGDSFAGGFMGFISERGSIDAATLRRAMLYGTVTASYCVQGFSVESLQRRTRADVDARYGDLLSIVSVG